MNTLSPFLSIDSPCANALQWTQQQLLRSGLRPIQTFDLQSARLGLHDCTCPNHGMENCDCQMVVLLVYGQAAEPVTLILHGNSGKTWIAVSDNPLYRADPVLANKIRQTLEKVPSSTSCAG
jgi:hypothetical protein